MRVLLSILGVFVATTLPVPSFATGASWTHDARRLTGESGTVRVQMIARLRKIPRLKSTLLAALSTSDRALACDVLVALQMHEALPDLIRLSETDETGLTYLAINTLATKNDLGELGRLYHVRALASRTSDASRMVLIDTLARMGVRLPEGELKDLLLDRGRAPEIRSAALNYLRHFALHYGEFSDLKLLGRLLEERNLSPQLRMQALYFYTELPGQALRVLGPIKPVCPDAVPAALKKVCA